ncbi:MAG: hydroxyacylglutathione hydrolase [Xanthomonadales bacterium]|nr:hydroxyacylglutathione hydrolase [Xanthomonadales bacterium]
MPKPNVTEVKVTAIPAFADNYIWLISTGGTLCAVVDPGDDAPVRRVLDREGLELAYILLTHHHADHIGGAAALADVTGAEVCGPHDSRIPHRQRSVGEGDTVELPRLGLRFEVLEVPGHTTSHIAFVGHGCLFCGDTLFSVGCGRLFEGTPAQMQASLDKLAALPPATSVYCGHEYTVANCAFALEVEPANDDLQRRARAAESARSAGRITLPSTLGEELAVNPFLRSRQPAVVEAARRRDPAAEPGASTLAAIRAWKDTY